MLSRNFLIISLITFTLGVLNSYSQPLQADSDTTCTVVEDSITVAEFVSQFYDKDRNSGGPCMGNTFPMNVIPKFYPTPDDLWKTIEFTFDKTQELISLYESNVTLDYQSNDIGFTTLIDLDGDIHATIQMLSKYKYLLQFVSDIAGFDIYYEYSSYSDPTQFISIPLVKEVLDYYDTHIIDKDEIYIYYYVNLSASVCTVLNWAHLYKDLPEGYEFWFLNENKIKEFPDSSAAALYNIEESSDTIKKSLFNILNKKSIDQLTEEAKQSKND